MRIVHAVYDEHGKASGGSLGDQTGKEIVERRWYDRPWDVYLEPPRILGKRAADIACKIAEGNFGYSQQKRWSGYNAIIDGGIDNAVGDFDCSSLVISCYILAGADMKPMGYTGNLERILKECGFKSYDDEAHLIDPNNAVAGGIYLARGKHVCICVEDGRDIVATNVSDSPLEYPYILRIRTLGSVRIRTSPKVGRTVKIVKRGTIVNVLSEDFETGWYYTDDGWITNNERYVEVINEE